MFTIEQIKTAHSKVKSGADFPAYIRDIRELGVTCYKTFVSDGHTDYSGSGGYAASSPAKYQLLTIAGSVNADQFKADLQAHQQGGSDYLTFCKQAAAHGIEKWVVKIEDLTCTYYDKAGNEILAEVIPQ